MTERERISLTVIGGLALAGLGAGLWRRPRAAAPEPVLMAQAAQWDAALHRARQVDVNTADAAALERLPQIGPALARRIVEERQRGGPFSSAADLTRVRGIGPKTHQAFEPYVTTEADGARQ